MTIKLRGSTDGSVSISAPADTSPSGADITLTLPTDAGSANQFLKNGGTAGTLDYSSMVEFSNGHVAIGATTDTAVFRSSAADGEAADVYVGVFENLEETAGQSYGVNIRAGSNSTDHGFRVRNRANDATQFLVRGDGNVGIGDTAPDALLSIKGDSDANTTPSIRLKDGDDTREAWISNTGGDLVLNVGGDDNVPHGTIKLFESGLLTFSQGANERFRCDSSGRVGIGNNPSNLNANADDLVVGSGSGTNGITIYSGSSDVGNIYFADGTSTEAEQYAGGLNYNHSNNQLNFFTNGGQTRMYIDSTGLQVNYRDTSTTGVSLLLCKSDHGGTDRAQWYVLSDGTNENRSGTYGTISSDERMKKDIVDATSQWEDIKNIRMRKFRYKADADNAPLQLGVVAQELETVCPNLVTRKPATAEMSAESEGLIAEGEDILSWKQSIVHLKALKALQEAMERIETLEAKVAALEAAE